jgi:hypothetical protein
MDRLKIFCRTFTHTFKRVWFLPQTIAYALKLRRQRIVLREDETERLDRIRNPSKYLGK